MAPSLAGVNAAYAVGAAVVAVVAVVVIRALRAIRGRRVINSVATDALHNVFMAKRAEIAGRLSEALQKRTVSYDRPDIDRKVVCGGIGHDHGKPAVTSAAAAPKDAAEEAAAVAAYFQREDVRESAAQMLELHALLAARYPLMHTRLETHAVATYSRVYVWYGTDRSLPATALYAHMDVVPVTDGPEWRYPPFSGTVADGYVHGRGAIDDKQAVIAICEAVEHLLGEGAFTPKRTVVILFGHDEEIGGELGAGALAEWVHHHLRVCLQNPAEEGAQAAGAGAAEKNTGRSSSSTGARRRKSTAAGSAASSHGHTHDEADVSCAHLPAAPARTRRPLAFLLDEGLFVLKDAVPGLERGLRTALVCTSEKGYVNVELKATTAGGHASSPPAETAVGILSRAITRLEAHQFPPHYGDAGPVPRMFAALTPYFKLFPFRLIFANLWLFQPLVERIFAAKPQTAIMVRTTTAPTILRAGTKANTLSPTATAIVNHRIHPAESVASVLARDARVIADGRIALKPMGAVEPSPVSDDAAPAFGVLQRAVEGLFVDTVAVPGLMVGATDSKWTLPLADNVFRHCPTELHASETGMFHGRDERIAVDNLARIAAFYTRVILDADAAVQL